MKEKSHKKGLFIIALIMIALVILFKQGFFGNLGLGNDEGSDLNIVSIEDTPQNETQEETPSSDNEVMDEPTEEKINIVTIKIVENDVYIDDTKIASDELIKELEENYPEIERIKLISDDSKLVKYTEIKKELEKYEYIIEE